MPYVKSIRSPLSAEEIEERIERVIFSDWELNRGLGLVRWLDGPLGEGTIRFVDETLVEPPAWAWSEEQPDLGLFD